MKQARGYQGHFYDQHQSVQDEDSRIKKALKIRTLFSSLESFPFSSSICLDIGCSSGIMTCELASMFRKMFAIDYDVVVLNKNNRSDTCQAAFLRGDALMLPFSSGSLDVIICAQVYEHVPNDERLVSEMNRVLKPGGIIFFSGPNKLFPIELHYSLPFLHWLPEKWADAYLRLFKRGDHYYERSRTMRSLRRLLKDFEIQDVTLQVLKMSEAMTRGNWISKLLRVIPVTIWRQLLFLFPNFNWILNKPIEKTFD
jgi:2-polyprenyl-3-methyl-5-hydroxy-6-metoxy-1,4-benzoquinol methylase